MPPFKVRLTLNIIFGMCNIWVILRRNVIYLYSKNLILINFFTAKVPDMMSLGEFLVQKTKENYFAIHLMTSYPETLTVKKLIKMGFFIVKICYNSSVLLRMT